MRRTNGWMRRTNGWIMLHLALVNYSSCPRSFAATGNADVPPGTRMCAGNHLASRQLYIMLLRLIWAFKLELSTDPAENTWSIHPLHVMQPPPPPVPPFLPRIFGFLFLLTVFDQDSTEPDQFTARPPVYKLRFLPRNEKALRQQLERVDG